MASLKNKKGSPFWWIKHRNSFGKIVEIKTQYKIGTAQAKRMAEKEVAELALAEAQRKICNTGGKWEDWVPEYLATRFAASPKTLKCYVTRWNNLRWYLKCLGLNHPRLFQRELAFRYIGWRKKEKSINGGTWQEEPPLDKKELKKATSKRWVRKAKQNTALAELKLLSLLFREAVRRKYATENPLAELGVKREAAPEKPALTDEQIACIRKMLANDGWPRWMSIAFETALYTGCRLEETCVYLADVWIDDANPLKSTIGFRKPKGGRNGDKAFRVPLRPELIPMFKKLKSERPGPEQRAYEPLPPDGCSEWWTPSRALHRLFRADPLLAGCCFHCTRVTFVTRGAQANVSVSKMMRLVNHASSMIHRIYQRLQSVDVEEDSHRIQLPPAA